ncbi:alpha/beta hydrolase [Legionella micdadei]|uniref:Uncharacterized protein n=1 Tax=Legionella micdadei TaxID=451 RepID=A0A098GH23_LEGMI|nr:alpha/beta hydrolase [Legionella micdadei]ARG96843.1 alpha/beta hydrolase [Legionella micdadei]KTD26523.1 ATPases involved in biogenesis of archaeal flagella [Legionella micdadei]NSL17887.1 alpha/beta hydrolase [Legionella micdadei]CEG61759.1 conserved protein of unknown function [Legionella micdadei]SCY22634.1 hypothetical protein SAMN02982997_01135 [Legionella micdadei]
MKLLIRMCILVIFIITESKAENLEIQVNGLKISLTYWSAQNKKAHGGILIIKGDPFWEGFALSPNLAKRFAKLGWSVAILDTNQQQDKLTWIDVLPEALSNLRQKNNQRIVVLYYGAQLKSLLGYFSKLQSKQVNGLILLSAFDESSSNETLDMLKKIPFPVFDVVGQFDYSTVLRQATLRRENNHSNQYIALQFPGATHDYLYTRNMLVGYLHGWMKHLRPVTRSKPPVLLN